MMAVRIRYTPATRWRYHTKQRRLAMFNHLFKTDLSADEEQRIIDDTLKYYGENLNPGFVEFKRSA